MTNSLNITIIGSGPVGITAAATLKAINPKLNVIVLDKREARNRNYGLSVDSESANAVTDVIDEALKSVQYVKDGLHETRLELRNTVKDWGKGGFVQTSDIEIKIQNIAERLGVVVKRNKKFTHYLSKDKFVSLLNTAIFGDDAIENELKTIFKNTDLLIGADGTRSVVGETIIPEKSFQKTYEHNALLKYQVDGSQEPRSPKVAAYHASLAGEVAFESVSRKKGDQQKPTTLNIFIDKDVYDILYKKNDKGEVIKGDAANPYTLQELREEANKNPKVKKLLHHILLQLKDKHATNILISVLPLEMYQSEHSYTEFEGKSVLKIGDANSTLILQRGFRKGLKEIGILARTMINVSNNPADSKKFYADYEKKVQTLYMKERWWVEFRSGFLRAAILIFKLIGRLFQALTRDVFWQTLEADALMRV